MEDTRGVPQGMLIMFTAATMPEMEEDKELPVASPTLMGMFFNQAPVEEEENFGGLDQDLWWEDNQQDFNFDF